MGVLLVILGIHLRNLSIYWANLTPQVPVRKAVRTVNQHFNQLKVAQAPDKTFVGRIEKEFIPGILAFTLRVS
jgi:hypothetical protein